MAVAFVNSGTVAQSNSASSLTPALPTSRVNGNLLIAIGSANSNIAGIAWTGTGWTNSATNGNQVRYAWRYVTGSEAAPTFNPPSGQSFAAAAVVLQFSGVKPTTPFGNTNKGASGISVTTSADGSLVLGIGGQNNHFGDATDTTHGFTVDVNVNGGTIGTSVGAAQKQVATNGTSTTYSPVAESAGVYLAEILAIPTETSTIDQTLANISQEVDVTVTSPNASSTIDQTLFNISQSLADTDTPNADIAQTLPGAIQEILITTEVIIEGIDQTLPGAIQDLLAATEIEITSLASTFFPMTQSLSASIGAANHIVMRLPGVLQEAVVVAEIEITSINTTFFNIQQLFEADQTPPVVIHQTLPSMVQDAEFIVSVDAQIDLTFPTMDQFPRFSDINMVLGGSTGGGTYRTWWRASCGP